MITGPTVTFDLPDIHHVYELKGYQWDALREIAAAFQRDNEEDNV